MTNPKSKPTKDSKPDEWHDAVAREFEQPFVATFEDIGKQLRFELAKIIGEPLPPEIHDHLSKLEKAEDGANRQPHRRPNPIR